MNDYMRGIPPLFGGRSNPTGATGGGKITGDRTNDKPKSELAQGTKDSEWLGQLIAEISKFGGFDKKKSSQLAKILLPHITTAINEAVIKAVDDKLVTLSEAVGYMGICEEDLNKILIWVKNHRWSLIAPPGENTQSKDIERE